jgi:hypothetical protein
VVNFARIKPLFSLKDLPMTPLLSDLIEQFWRSRRSGLNQSRVWHLAAFLAGLPSRGQEIGQIAV